MSLALILSLAVLWSGEEPGDPQVRSREYRLKALFLLQFADYIRYPPHPRLPRKAFTIGVIGNSPILAELRRLAPIVGEKRKRRYRILFFPNLEKVRPCHILFLPGRDADTLKRLRRRVKGMPVALVGEGPDFARKGCLINFYLRANRVRFEVNLDAEREMGLKISAHLLRVARIVREQ